MADFNNFTGFNNSHFDPNSKDPNVNDSNNQDQQAYQTHSGGPADSGLDSRDNQALRSEREDSLDLDQYFRENFPEQFQNYPPGGGEGYHTATLPEIDSETLSANHYGDHDNLTGDDYGNNDNTISYFGQEKQGQGSPSQQNQGHPAGENEQPLSDFFQTDATDQNMNQTDDDQTLNDFDENFNWLAGVDWGGELPGGNEPTGGWPNIAADPAPEAPELTDKPGSSRAAEVEAQNQNDVFQPRKQNDTNNQNNTFKPYTHNV